MGTITPKRSEWVIMTLRIMAEECILKSVLSPTLIESLQGLLMAHSATDSSPGFEQFEAL